MWSSEHIAIAYIYAIEPYIHIPAFVTKNKSDNIQ